MGTCSNCGYSILPNDISCNSCGSPQKQTSSGGFCGNCGTPLASKLSPCSKCGHVKTTFAPPPSQPTSFCGGCGSQLASKLSPCSKCGHVKTTFAPPPNYGAHSPGIPSNVSNKDSGIALILSVVLGIFSICGVGQIYVGRVGRGIGILILGWVLLVIGVATMGIGLLLYLGFFIWQVYDTNNLCKQYNYVLNTSGRPPW